MTILVITLDLLKKKSKAVFWITLVFLWIIMAFTYGNADETVYISRYNNPELWVNQTELFYGWILKFFNKLGFTFYQYKAIITAIQLLLISSTIRKFAIYPNLVLLLYFIYPFMLNVAQMRNALATSIFIFAIRYLIDDSGKKFNFTKNSHLTIAEFKYILFILMATMIHSASIIWLVLLVAKKCSLKFNILFMFIFNILIGFVISPVSIIKVISGFGAASRISSYLSKEYQNTEWRHYGTIVLVIGIAVTVCFIIYYMKKHKISFDLDDNIEKLLKINIIILVICAIILRYTSEAYRLQEGLFLVNYIFLTNSLKSINLNHSKKSLNHCVVSVSLYICVLFAAWYLILRYNMEIVFLPIFKKNMIFTFLN